MATRKTIFLTGANGFLAKHICLRLLFSGYKVRGSVRSNSRAREVISVLRDHKPADFDQHFDLVELDLDDDRGWAEAFEGVEALIHTAFPVPLIQPRDPYEFTDFAQNGTLRVLRAAMKSGVNRIVFTSSLGAVCYREPDPGRKYFDESDWTELDFPSLTPYARAKTLAERTAWSFAHDEAPATALTSIVPGFVIGPPVGDQYGASVEIVRRLLAGNLPVLPRISFPIVDVRTIAELHVQCLPNQATVGKRIIAAGRPVSLFEIANTLSAAFPDRKLSTSRSPDWLVRLGGLFSRELHDIALRLGVEWNASSALAAELLGYEPTDPTDTLIDTAESLIGHGILEARQIGYDP
jgi:dihydroflavonol-4-reductase